MTPHQRPKRQSCVRCRRCITRRAREMADVRRLLEPVLAIHARIRASVVDACARQEVEALATVAADDGVDTIYAIDRVSETTLVEGLRDVADDEPLWLIAEGLPLGGLILP